ncbi:MAG TPA: hypothetical protein VF138_01565 [Caulobacteraceae bacterium]
MAIPPTAVPSTRRQTVALPLKATDSQPLKEQTIFSTWLCIQASCLAAAVALNVVCSSTAGLMQPDALSTKAAVLARAPVGAPISVAEKVMRDGGFECSYRFNERYADYANREGAQVTQWACAIFIL